jgi:penicillin amidase
MSSEPDAVWTGWLPPEDFPVIVDTDRSFLWTANARQIDGPDLEKIGHGYSILGARGLQIRRRLEALTAADEHDMLDIQLDARADFVQRWRSLLRSVLCARVDVRRGQNRRREAIHLLDQWDGNADGASVGYRLVREFRDRVDGAAFAPIVARVRKRFPDFDLSAVGDQREGPLWSLVTSKPQHFLDPRYSSWDDLLHQAAEGVLRSATRFGSMSRYTWGRVNTLEMRHPLGRVLPPLAWLMDMPRVPLSGDVHMPLAQLRDHGPVVRFVVSPGREASGIMQMPGGQSGHPLSPYYGAGHLGWVHGAPSPFLPGPTRYVLTLRATSSSAHGAS